jgi:hypothetical protein
MTVEATTGEELENKRVPLQEEDEEEEENEPGVTPGTGKFLSSDMSHFSSHRGFREQTVQRRKRKRRSPRRRRQPSLIPRGSDFLNFSQAECIRRERSASTKTSKDNSDLPSIQSYPQYTGSNSWRTTSEEKRYDERMVMEDPEATYDNIRRAAEVHRQVRQAARKFIRPGQSMIEIAEYIENGTRALVEENGLESGVGFPTGLSLNNCAAHYSPNGGDTTGKPAPRSQPMVS